MTLTKVLRRREMVRKVGSFKRAHHLANGTQTGRRGNWWEQIIRNN